MSVKVSTGPVASGRVRRSTVRTRAASSSRPNGLVTYTIMSVNPGADSFTVFLNGWLVVNKGAAITDGIGFMACAH